MLHTKPIHSPQRLSHKDSVTKKDRKLQIHCVFSYSTDIVSRSDITITDYIVHYSKRNNF